MTECKLAIHDMLYADAQIDETYCCKCMVSCTDDEHAIFFCCRQGTLRYQQITSDYERSRSVFYGCHLCIFAVSQNHKATLLNIVYHRLSLHCANDNAIS